MTGNEALFTLPSIAVKGKASDGVFCSRIFLLCTSLKYNYAIPSTDIGTLFLILANTETLCGRPQDILLLKGTKLQLSLVSFQRYACSFMPVLHFSSDRALLQKEGLKKDDGGLHNFATQIIIG